MYTNMTKIISLSDEAYSELKKIKRNLSFSKLLLELAKSKRKDDLFEFAGMLTDEEAGKIKKEIYEDRKIKSRRFN
jgi:predicted CopG family antitoxin